MAYNRRMRESRSREGPGEGPRGEFAAAADEAARAADAWRDGEALLRRARDAIIWDAVDKAGVPRTYLAQVTGLNRTKTINAAARADQPRLPIELARRIVRDAARWSAEAQRPEVHP